MSSLFASLTFGSPGQGELQLGELFLALVLSSAIGLEREFRMKSAGLRTHTLVGVAAALIMLVSKYGFSDVLERNLVVLDPSRVAAQVVTGIGFIGGGLIFVQRDVVRGLTTAAAIWLTASVGMACGSGLPLLALFATGVYFLVMFGYVQIARRITSSEKAELLINYVAGKGTVRDIMKACTGLSFSVQEVTAHQGNADVINDTRAIQLRLSGRGRIERLMLALGDLEGVVSVNVVAPNSSE